MDNGELASCESPRNVAESKDDVLREVMIAGKRKFMESPSGASGGGSDDVDVGAISPRKLQMAHHHNNNDVSFVLIHQDGQSINEDLQNNNSNNTNNNDEVGLIL